MRMRKKMGLLLAAAATMMMSLLLPASAANALDPIQFPKIAPNLWANFPETDTYNTPSFTVGYAKSTYGGDYTVPSDFDGYRLFWCNTRIDGASCNPFNSANRGYTNQYSGASGGAGTNLTTFNLNWTKKTCVTRSGINCLGRAVVGTVKATDSYRFGVRVILDDGTVYAGFQYCDTTVNSSGFGQYPENCVREVTTIDSYAYGI
jgi:hypothetical protein